MGKFQLRCYLVCYLYNFTNKICKWDNKWPIRGGSKQRWSKTMTNVKRVFYTIAQLVADYCTCGNEDKYTMDLIDICVCLGHFIQNVDIFWMPTVMIWHGMAPKGLASMTLCYMGWSHPIKLWIVIQKILFSFIISL